MLNVVQEQKKVTKFAQFLLYNLSFFSDKNKQKHLGKFWIILARIV